MLIVVIGMVLASRGTAQTFRTLHQFFGRGDGAQPSGGLTLSGTTLYGAATYGGPSSNGTLYSGNGTIFKMNTDGTGFTTLHSFSDYSLSNGDGAEPIGKLVVSGNKVYGVAHSGGTWGNGTVFALNTDSTGFITLHHFTPSPVPFYTNDDGGGPLAGLILSGETLYGTTSVGGTAGGGTVFKLNTDGTGFTTVHDFAARLPNNDGTQPSGSLTLSGDTLYGTAYRGGSDGNGTVFKLNTNGLNFTVLHSFTAPVGYFTNSDGANPYGGLVLSGDTLYGTAAYGGILALGTAFAVGTDGTGFKTLHSFVNGDDGAYPFAGLIWSGNTLYGTASSSVLGSGTVFSLSSDGTGFEDLYSFTSNSDLHPINLDGARPGELILSGNTLYGMAEAGGAWSLGTVFSISLLPELTLNTAGASLVLSWPTNFAGFTLQSTTNLGPSAIWTSNSAAPLVVDGLNTLTTPLSGTQQFFRLSQ